MKTVNEQGLKEISNHLFDLHKQKSFTATELSYFVADIEDSLDAGGKAQFVIAAEDSQSGQAEVCCIGDEGYDIEYFDNSLNDYYQYKQTHDCKRSGCTVCVAFEH